jgi:RNA polymerase sigma-70 factor (ECF subfamily)
MTAFSSLPLPTDLLADFPLENSVPAAEVAASGDCPHEPRLIRGAQDGCHESFRLLVERHQAMIHRLCGRWMASAEDASEICQDTFLKAWQALPAWRPKAKFSTWLCRIAINLCRDRARSRASRQGRVTIPLSSLAATASPACSGLSPDSAAEQAGELEKLKRGLACLPEAMREVLILRGLENLSQKEAAAILGCSGRAVEGRLYRARQLLVEWWNTHP